MAGTYDELQEAGVASVTRLPRWVARRLWQVGLIAADLSMVLVGGVLATVLRFGELDSLVAFEGRGPEISFLALDAASIPLWAVFLFNERLYDLDRLLWGTGELGRVVRAATMATFAVVIGTFLFKWPGISRAWLVLFWFLGWVLIASERLALHAVVRRLRRAGHLLERAVVVGTNEEARHLVGRLRKDPTAGLVPVGYLGPEGFKDGLEDLPRLGDVGDIRELIREHRIGAVLVASTSLPAGQMLQVLSSLRGAPVGLHISSGLYQILTSRTLIKDVGGVPLVTVKGISLSPGNLLLKRVFDISVGLAAVVLLAPVWLTVATLIALTSPGPVLYRQTRVGRQGRPFEMYKFRSMVSDAEDRLDTLRDLNEADGRIFKIRCDPRVTRIGQFIRRFSIDELPQILNVLRGEMSLVGPRPPLPAEVEGYDEWHARRLEVTPGMTGLWQVSGRSDLSFDEMVRLDLYYIENWSVRFDLSIILRTIPIVLMGRGAY